MQKSLAVKLARTSPYITIGCCFDSHPQIDRVLQRPGFHHGLLESALGLVAPGRGGSDREARKSLFVRLTRGEFFASETRGLSSPKPSMDAGLIDDNVWDDARWNKPCELVTSARRFPLIPSKTIGS